jgi:hypothetical protein
MKISKVENLENTEPIQNDDLDDLDNENIQLGINKPNVDAVEKKKRIYKKKVIEPNTELTNDVKIQNPNEPTVLLKKELTENRGCAGDKVPAVKTKRALSEAQLLNWAKCLEVREANRLKRKAEKQQQEEERKKSLENKIIIKASRIQKAQSKVLGNLEELNDEPIEIPKKQIKQKIKKVVIYKSESENDSDYEEEKIVKKTKVAKKQTPVEPLKPTFSTIINFV